MSAVMPAPLPRSDGVASAEPRLRAGASRTAASVATPTAVDRLVASRARLRGAMMDIAHPPKQPSPLGDGVSHIGEALLRRLRALPGTSIILESVQSWWAQHPLRTASVMAEEATRTFVVPAAQRNPFTFIGVAALVGAVLMLARPWRWLIRPALFVGLVPQLLTHALKRLPATSWIDLIGKFGRASQKHKSAARRPSAQPATPPL